MAILVVRLLPSSSVLSSEHLQELYSEMILLGTAPLWIPCAHQDQQA